MLFRSNGTSWANVTRAASAATSATVSSLTNGTAYIFQVRARNVAGTSGFSTSSAAVTPKAVPGIPAAPTGTPGNGQVSLTWAAPAANGTPAISDYSIQYSSNGGTTWTAFPRSPASTTTSAVPVTGLTNGTSYLFRVAATNSQGTGLYSDASAAVTPRTLAGAPTGVTGTPGDGQVSLSWTAPASNGGAAITNYVVQYRTNTTGSTWNTFTRADSSLTSATVTGLTNGTAYVFRVAATNAAGTGANSAESSAATPRTVPGIPSGLTGTAGAGQASLSWTAPTSNGGNTISNYVIQYRVNTAGSSWTTFTRADSSLTTATVTGLTNGTTYVFRVAAANAAGAGANSAESAALTPLAAPAAPSGVTGISGDGRVTVRWRAPTDNGGREITDYVVQYRVNALNSSWTTFADGNSATTAATVTSLTNGTGYVFRIAAVNSVGTSDFSAGSAAVVPRPIVFAVATEIGSGSAPTVTLVNTATGNAIAQTPVFEPAFRGGVRVAMGDLDGDSVPEVVVASGPGRAGEIRVYKQAVSATAITLSELPTYRTVPFGSGYTGGVEIAVGDVDGDGREDIVAAMSRGAGTVNVFRSVNANDPIENAPYRSFTPFAATFGGGASVAVADIGTFTNGSLESATAADGRVEIVVGSGAGMTPTVLVYDISAQPRVVRTINTIPTTTTGGVSVASGRCNADAIDDIIVSAGRGGRSQSWIYSGRLDQASPALLATAAAFASLARPNAPLFSAALDLDGDGLVDSLYQSQGDSGGTAGAVSVSLANGRTGTLSGLKGPYRIAAPRATART